MSKYWEQRMLQRETEAQLIASKYVAKMEGRIREAQQDMIQQINKFYATYAADNDISLAAARKYLTSKELKEFKEVDLKRFRAMAKSGNRDYDRLLDAISYRVRISRIESLMSTLELTVLDLYGGLNGLEEYMYSGLMEVYQTTYYKTMYDFTVASMAAPTAVKRIAETEMKEILSYNWSGKEFSKRIWGHEAIVNKQIQKTLERSFVKGASLNKTAKALVETTNGSLSRAEALIRTETNAFQTLAANNSYIDAEIDRYEILATLDHRTSEICRRQDGKIYDVKDFKPGTNAPPFHVRCRSTTIPYFDESEYMEGEKRQSMGGLVDNMTYEKWYEKYIGGDDD